MFSVSLYQPYFFPRGLFLVADSARCALSLFATFLNCWKISGKAMLRVLTHTFNQVVAGRERLLQKVESSSTFATASRVARFTGPRQTCFAASDVTPVYGVAPA